MSNDLISETLAMPKAFLQKNEYHVSYTDYAEMTE